MFLRKYFRQQTFLVFISMLFIGLIGGIILNEIDWQQKRKVAQAMLFDSATGAGDAVEGFAWSPNFGWISFNSTDCDPNGDGIFGDGPWGCPDATVPFFDYGVDVEGGTGIFSGFAWSSNLGWIYFGPDADLSIYGLTEASSAPTAPLQWPVFDYDTAEVFGWAKVLALGDDGWISFRGTWTPGVSVDVSNSEVSGFAWNANDNDTGVGWISFSCSDFDTCSGGTDDGQACDGANCVDGTCIDTCSISNYHVYAHVNRPPSAVNLEAPFLTENDLCEQGVTRAMLKWEFEDPDNGAYEGAYRIIFDDDPDPSAPLFDSGKCDLGSAAPGCLITPGVDRFPIYDVVSLSYSTHYYWWVTVWDEHDSASTQVSSISYYADFSTPGHEWPTVMIDDFIPTLPSAGEEVKFWGSSSVYNYGSPASPVACENDGVNCTWYWSVNPPYYATVNDPATTTPIIIFNDSEQAFAVYLSVTDKDGFTCTSTPTLINPNVDLPWWIEVKPGT